MVDWRFYNPPAVSATAVILKSNQRLFSSPFITLHTRVLLWPHVTCSALLIKTTTKTKSAEGSRICIASVCLTKFPPSRPSSSFLCLHTVNYEFKQIVAEGTSFVPYEQFRVIDVLLSVMKNKTQNLPRGLLVSTRGGRVRTSGIH